MPEIGRPVTAQEQQYRQVTMGPAPLSGNKKLDQKEIQEQIINRASGQKPKSIYKDGPHNQMGKDEFLKLLTFQMQHQDPMNPMDQSKMTGELAQFSQLEQLTNLNAKYDKANQNQMIQDKFFAASFVGKEVITSGSTLKLTTEGESSDVLFKLDAPAKKIVIRIMDEKNQTIGEIWKENMSEGPQQITWDAVTLDGQPAGKGNYKAVVKAWDEVGNEVGAQTQATGLVTSVAFEDGEPVLTVDNQKVYLRDVSSFHEPKSRGMAQQNFPASEQQASALQLKNKVNASPAKAVQQYQDMSKGIYD